MNPDEQSFSKALEPFIGQEVVLDARGPIVYLGKLERVDTFFLHLRDSDVHDISEGRSTKERYILEARKHGIRKNREAVSVRVSEVISISLLEEVVPY